MKLKTLEAWQRKRLLCGFFAVLIVGAIYLSATLSILYNDKKVELDMRQNAFQLNEELNGKIMEYSKDAIEVSCGTYVENIKEVSLKTSTFRVDMMVWFNWDGPEELDMANHFRVYAGTINKKEIVKQSYKDGHCYQLVRMDVTITKSYWTVRFPLESHYLRIYIEPTYPINDVRLIADEEHSAYSPAINMAGFKMMGMDTGTFDMQYPTTQGDPEFEQSAYSREHVTQLAVNRADFGLYAKCFIALLGTITWVMITLFICTYHRVDPLSMIPAALFGTVTNIMVGANLVPDALDMGLLEYVNVWNIMIILMSAISIININRIRNKYEDREFAGYFGKVMFYTVFSLALLGNILLPSIAYIW